MAAYHARSASLPCRSHPIIAHFHTHIGAVSAWAKEPATFSTASGLALANILDLHEAPAAHFSQPAATATAS